MSALLDVSQVCKTFTRGGLFSSRRIHAVNDVSFRIDAASPEIFTIIGESGSGKTTLSRMILNIEQPSSGALMFDGTNLATVRSSADRMVFMHKAPVSRGWRSDRHRCGRR
jgi:ABC-type oligopeptide transport system ATPase subunit